MARATSSGPKRTAKPEPETGVPAVEAIPEPEAEPAGGPRNKLAEASELVPGWLALLVLVLLLAVAGLGGYLIRGAVMQPDRVTRTQYAVESLEQDVRDEPDNLENQLALGYAYQQEGRYDEALARYEEVLQQDPTNTGALYNKGIALMATGKSKDAEAVLWDLMEIAPDHVLGAKALGEYYVDKKHYKSALVALEPVVALQPQYADLQYLAGYSCEMLGRGPEAVAYYRAALTYNPDMSEAKDGLARLGEPQ